MQCNPRYTLLRSKGYNPWPDIRGCYVCHLKLYARPIRTLIYTQTSSIKAYLGVSLRRYRLRLESFLCLVHGRSTAADYISMKRESTIISFRYQIFRIFSY